MIPKDAPKEISSKEKRSVNNIVSEECGETITIVCCLDAPENFSLPMFTFHLCGIKPKLPDWISPSSVATVSDSDFVKCDFLH
jgi:hypothetical protein